MIAVLAYISMAFLGLRFLVVISNTLFHFITRNRWHNDTLMVSVLIPARNEESNIGHLLDCLMAQDYKNIEVIICDDHSTDGTAAILGDYSAKFDEIKWFPGKALPDGWTGKNYACHQLAEKATGELFLFLDADMEIAGDIICKSAGYMEKQRLTLLSIFPKQITNTFGERITVPLMNWILLSLLPLPLVVYSSWTSFSAANGQFMLFRADHYRKLKCHKMVKSSAVEDIRIVKELKKMKYRVSTLLGDDRVMCRMYSNYSDAVAGFSKNVLQFFSNNLVWAFFYILFSTLGLFFVFLWNPLIGLIYLVVALLNRTLISMISYQDVVNNLLYIIPQQFAFLKIIFTAFRNKRKGNLEWKGRTIST